MTTTPHAGLETLDYVGLALYLLVTAGIVYWSSRRQNTTEDFFLGGRQMPWLAVGLSVMATLLSTITYLALPGEMIKNGIAMFAGYLGIPFAAVVILRVWVPFFMRLRVTSAYEYLELRFNRRTRMLANVLFLLLRLGWMSVVVYTASLGLARMTDIPLMWVIGPVGLAAAAYACVGGLRAVVWNDVLQAVMLFGGTFLIIGYVMWVTGSGPTHWWDSITAAADASSRLNGTAHTKPLLFSFDPTVRATVLTAMIQVFVWNVCTHGCDQVVLQRYFATTSLSAARGSFIVNIISNVMIALLLSVCGLALLYFYTQFPSNLPPGLTMEKSADEIMPYFYSHQLPAGLGGLVLAGFLCDAMQTLVSGVNSISAITSHDVFQKLFPRGSRWTSELAVARWLAVGVGLIATGCAYMVAWSTQYSNLNIMDLQARTFNIFLGPLACLFLIGMFLPRCTARSTIPAAVFALLVGVFWNYFKEITGTEASLTITMAVAVPYVSGFLMAAFLSMFESKASHAGHAYTWRNIMRRAPAGATASGSPDA